MNKRFLKISRNLIGHHSTFSLENRIFNSVSLLSLAGMIIALPLDFFIGYPLQGILISLLIIALLGYLYYLSRYRKKFNVSRLIYAAASYVFVITNFIYNSGINGSNIYVFFLTFSLIIAISPKREYLFWAITHLIVAIALVLFQWNFPELVPNVYATEGIRVVDFIFTYTLTLLLMYFIASFVKVNYDFEKKKVIEKNMAIEIQKLELEKTNEEKNKMFSIISHDFRSPLNSIQGYLEALAHNMFNENEKTAALKELVELTNNTSAMLNDLLSWAKTQMDGLSADITPVNLFDTLRGIVSRQTVLANQKGIELRNEIGRDVAIFADANMMQVVVRNLLNNAIKFTQPGGLIELSAEKIKDKCCISVRDNGIGILPQNQKDIFSVKTQTTSGTGNERGIGLGLVLCKEFTELQGGEISFESKAGNGTTFYVSMPVSED